MTKGLNEQVNEFRNRTLSNTVYPILWVDALYEKVRVDGRIVSMAVVWMKWSQRHHRCGNYGRGIQGLVWFAVSALEGPWSCHTQADHFRCSLRVGFGDPGVLPRSLLAALQGAFHAEYPGLCTKKSFACVLKEIWLAPTAELARKRAYDVMDTYAKRFPKAVQCLENGLEDSLTFYAFPKLDARKISSSNMIERLNREIRRRTSVVGIFPNEASYVRLVTTYLMEYAEDWSVSRAYLSQESIQATLLIAA